MDEKRWKGKERRYYFYEAMGEKGGWGRKWEGTVGEMEEEKGKKMGHGEQGGTKRTVEEAMGGKRWKRKARR